MPDEYRRLRTGHRRPAPRRIRDRRTSRGRRRHPAQHLRDSRACRGARARPPRRSRSLQVCASGAEARAARMHGATQSRGAGREGHGTSTWSRVPMRYRRLPEMLGRGRLRSRRSMCASIAPRPTPIFAPRMPTVVRAYVTAMRGCDKFCAFCVVPYVRGRERSVPPDDLLREIRELAERGVSEVMLLGQTVNAYRFDDVDFGALLRMIARDRRHRADPLHLTASQRHERLGDRCDGDRAEGAALSCICRCNRDRSRCSPRWNAATPSTSISRWCEACARAIPGLAMSTDIIVGFHGEDDSDFRATLDVMRR